MSSSLALAVLTWGQLSILPITFGLLRYGLLLERGQGGAPEDVVLGDRPLLSMRAATGGATPPRCSASFAGGGG